MTTYTAQQKQRIKRAALRALKRDSSDDKESFMSDCIDETGDEDMCEILWDEGSE